MCRRRGPGYGTSRARITPHAPSPCPQVACVKRTGELDAVASCFNPTAAAGGAAPVGGSNAVVFADLAAAGSIANAALNRISYGRSMLSITTLDTCIVEADVARPLDQIASSFTLTGLTSPLAGCQFNADAFDHVLLFTRAAYDASKGSPMSLDHAYDWLDATQSTV